MTDLSDITNNLTQENLRALVRMYFDAWKKAEAENERLRAIEEAAVAACDTYFVPEPVDEEWETRVESTLIGIRDALKVTP